jgi:hypothetical protein
MVFHCYKSFPQACHSSNREISATPNSQMLKIPNFSLPQSCKWPKFGISSIPDLANAPNSEFQPSADLQMLQIWNSGLPRPCNCSEFGIPAFRRPAESRNSLHGDLFTQRFVKLSKTRFIYRIIF